MLVWAEACAGAMLMPMQEPGCQVLGPSLDLGHVWSDWLALSHLGRALCILGEPLAMLCWAGAWAKGF